MWTCESGIEDGCAGADWLRPATLTERTCTRRSWQLFDFGGRTKEVPIRWRARKELSGSPHKSVVDL